MNFINVVVEPRNFDTIMQSAVNENMVPVS